MRQFATFGYRSEGVGHGGNRDAMMWMSSIPSPPAGRWKCPDCDAWVANWIAVHRCNKTGRYPFGERPVRREGDKP